MYLPIGENMKKRKGFTLMELIVVITVSGWVLATVMLSYQTITNQTARKRAQSETEEYLNMLNLGFQRTFGSMSIVKLISGDSTPLTIETPGFYQRKMITSYSFSQGCAQIDPPYSSGNTYSSTKFGTVLVLFVFSFDNPLLNKAAASTDLYRMLGVSSLDSNGHLTRESNFIYIDQDPTTGAITAEKILAGKPKRLWLRKISIGPDTSSGYINLRLLGISLGVRDYMNTPKIREDGRNKMDPYNYETTKFYTLLIRSQ